MRPSPELEVDSTELRSGIQEIVAEFKAEKRQLVGILRKVQERWRHIPKEAIALIADELDLPQVHVEGTATFYHFFSRTHRGKYTVYLNTSITSVMKGYKEVAQAFENEAGISFGQTSDDLQIGLRKTSCIGMSDQEPSALINDVVFTKLTPVRVAEIVAAIKRNEPMQSLIRNFGDGNNSHPSIRAEVSNNIRLKGPVHFSEFIPGTALKAAFEQSSLDVIELVKKSGLRGRGGAGFPAGQKWAMCRETEAESRYLFCNVDEGEPGTFKDRVLLTERPYLVFEAMAVAGYAIEATRGIVYLRGEYAYLKPYLEGVLRDMRARKLLGKKILGTHFSFDIAIKLGAGAYICGEESALIESAEGKRGTPRNRPPYPVVAGYRHRPTVVNNPETLCCAAKIVMNGPEWFKDLGTKDSSGVKLLSIAGDCARPGIYEVEWGKTVREVLDLCGAKDVLAVQVGGPSGVCISEKQFERKICYEDIPTGGAFTIFGKHRKLLEVVHNYMDFFAEESCGFCVPCRAGNEILLKSLEKVMVGNGTFSDLEGIKRLGKLVKATSRCGLGQTSPNPLLTTIENFPEYYSARVRQDVDYLSQFDMSFATTESCMATHRRPEPDEKHEVESWNKG